MEKLIKQIMKFGVVGGSAFVIDYGIMIFLTEVFHINYLISSGISFAVSVIFNYVMSVKWVFEVEENRDKKCVVLAEEGWHHGVIGIVSSKITELTYKPSILICIEGEDAKGSGRSIPGFDLHEAVGKCKEYLTAFGRT